MPAGYVTLILAVVAAAAVAVLLVALRFAPSPTPNPTLVNSPVVTTSPATTAVPVQEDLRYDVTATRNHAREAKVKATAYGQPEPGLTYWFFVDVDYGKHYVEYYPRRKLTGRTTSFDIDLSADADLQFPRTGRIYGLTSAQSTEAAVRQQRQETTKKELLRQGARPAGVRSGENAVLIADAPFEHGGLPHGDGFGLHRPPGVRKIDAGRASSANARRAGLLRRLADGRTDAIGRARPSRSAGLSRCLLRSPADSYGPPGHAGSVSNS
ncbi:hypothetical protein BJ973_004397 [Actinoplanes tereljensis]|nr:hypothetical protein [Actinoplanes tereljensis]